MSKITLFVAAIARYPVNFAKKVTEDIAYLNEKEAAKPPKLTDITEEEMQKILQARARASK